ncbi:MAG: YkgJ family cysteine cluster protein [Deltaproteobacteria bacterium]|nr:YkgJ family cysteine cluster protein [Deltaproteobacteria bacterium]
MTNASGLCTDCGICCDGTLFSSVTLNGTDLATTRGHRLPVVKTADGHKLELPCAALRGVLCGIYEERPECCADYACELLVRVADGRLSMENARDIIEVTRATRARVKAAVGATPWWLAQRSAIEAVRADGDWARDHAELVADLDTLEMLVGRHFRG